MPNPTAHRPTPTPLERMRTGLLVLFLALLSIEIYVLYQAWSRSFDPHSFPGQMLIVNTLACAFAGALVVLGFRETRTGA